jgi:hypothetical protein
MACHTNKCKTNVKKINGMNSVIKITILIKLSALIFHRK